MNAYSPLTRSTRLMVLAVFVGAGFTFGPVAANFQPAEAGYQQQLLREHNKLRKKRNKPRLRLAGPLKRSSRKYAKVMAANNHFSHTGPAPGFSEFDDRIKAEGFNKAPMGENIAQGYRTVKEAFRGWKRSPGHRRNILNRQYQSVGFGKASGPNGPYWVADFGG